MSAYNNASGPHFVILKINKVYLLRVYRIGGRPCIFLEIHGSAYDLFGLT